MSQSPFHSSWDPYLLPELKKPYMQQVLAFLKTERKAGKSIYPPAENIFQALKLTPFDQVKVVILGQDPYHGEGQAHGLCFSVNKGVKIPPSLVNIFKELESDLGITSPDHGNLTLWANQGVLLLNTVLSVEYSKPGSHHKKGWEQFTDKVIEVLNQQKKHLVFVLWGAPAQKKASAVDQSKHFIIESPHPSPLSSYRGFFGSKPFSKTNDYLVTKGLAPVNWKLS